jgi:hypothetical protein
MATQVYRMTLTWNIGGQFAQSIFHWRFDDSGFTTSAAAASALNVAWDTAYDPSFAGFFPNDTSLLSLKSRKVSELGGFEAFNPLVAPLAGTRGGQLSCSAPNPVATFFPVDGNRRRGRWFLPGVSDDDVINGRMVPAYVTAINALLGTQFDDLTLVGGGGPTAEFIIYDPKFGAQFKPVLIKLADKVGTLRRRQRPA